MNHQQRDQAVYDEARQFLLSHTPKEITEEILESYLSLPKPTHENLSLNDLYLKREGKRKGVYHWILHGSRGQAQLLR